ncbi:MAG: tetratricopeptide repeat protein [bacterium]
MPTFLFTDIEGSSEKWEKYSNEMSKALAIHDAILKKQIEKHNGKIFKHTGDGVLAIFEDGEPIECALQLQKHFQSQNWGNVGELRIRIALHMGEADRRGGDFFGSTVNRTARILNACWGGQILLTSDVINHHKIPQNSNLIDHGTHLLKDLTEPQQLFSLVHPDLKIVEFPPLRTMSRHPHNLPTQLTPFINRERELTEIAKLINNPSCRLITLTGLGGIGKTRLAIQIGAEYIEKFENGVFFIPLAPLSSSNFIIPTIADSLRFSFYSNEDPRKQLINYLKDKEMLLIMDNCEHLIEGVDIISDILKDALRIKILATSRERLNLSGEWVFQVDGMSVPDVVDIDIEKFSSVQLFLHVAKRVSPDWKLKDDDKRWITRICQLVDGLPLGIELSSSWIRMLSTKDIAMEVEKSYGFLTTQLRDVPERHRGLRVVFEYSYKLLTDAEKDILIKLSMFRGGFTREAVECVAEASILVLSSLVDKSLVRINQAGRYEIHEVIRQFVYEKLDENNSEKENVKKRHSEYYATFVNQREEGLIGENQIEVIAEIAEEIENIRTGLSYAIERYDVLTIDKYIDSLSKFYDIRSWFSEGEEIMGRMVSKLRDRKVSDDKERGVFYKCLGKAISRYGTFLYRLGKYNDARISINESLSILRETNDKKEIVYALCFLGETLRMAGDYSEATTVLKESIEISKEINDQYLLALSINNLGNIETLLGNYTKAEKLYKESLTIRKNISNVSGIASSLMNLGTIYYYIEEHSKSKEFYEEALEIFKKLNDRRGVALTLSNLGGFETIVGNYEAAENLFNKSIEISRKIGDRTLTARGLNNLGITLTDMGNYEKAEISLNECIGIYRESGDKRGTSVALNNLANVYLGKGDLERAVTVCEESLGILKEIGYRRGIASSLLSLGNLYTRMNRYREAKDCLLESHSICNEINYRGGLSESLMYLGILSYKQGEYETAWEQLLKALDINITLKVVPHLLKTLLAIAKLLKIETNKEKSLEIISFILNHPTSPKDLLDEANEILGDLEAELPIKIVAEALKKGKEKSLDDIIREVFEMKSRE